MSTTQRFRIVTEEGGGYRVENVVETSETVCEFASYDEAAEWIRTHLETLRVVSP